MIDPALTAAWELMGRRFRAHPWHGVPIGEQAPDIVTSFIEIVPDDPVKFEVDKASGYLKVDRPQQYSNVCPTMYGFIPQTYCGDAVAALCAASIGRANVLGDGDPLDICVLSEKAISHGDILVEAIPIGGLRVLDRDEADDKVIAIMAGDIVYGGYRDISDCPEQILDRIKHYFVTYKQQPTTGDSSIEVAGVYGAEEAREVIRCSQRDYTAKFGTIRLDVHAPPE